MKYFWHFLLSVSFLALIVFLFFVFSVQVKDNVTYTDEKKPTEPEITIADPSLGPGSAPVTIVNYGDYSCPSCARLEVTLQELRSEYGDALRIVWKDMPNTSQHPEALNAAIAARCAGEQKKFWEYHSLLMANQSLFGAELYPALAAQLKLKERPFARCLENQETAPLVERTYNEGVLLNVTATPTIFINGERFTGGMTNAELKRAIEPILK
jgi:protein-disulfide isomerase